MLKDDFETFCSNIELDNLEEMKTTIKEITKKLNKYYYDTEDKEKHMYTVGSVGRGTAIKNTSDLDILFDLPSLVDYLYHFISKVKECFKNHVCIFRIILKEIKIHIMIC